MTQEEMQRALDAKKHPEQTQEPVTYYRVEKTPYGPLWFNENGFLIFSNFTQRQSLPLPKGKKEKPPRS